ncbi:methyl-accepting chemotaxis protein [Kushneria aurantia]|uniref:Methyl-accepting chemotaxis protein n=1 Tax=Kushneria aurantia TaxID=504092 RepID=A0ABV6G490_9GAMM|nr:methyl-accepting chemotaxis protein [Kushneria aurantia]
MLGLDRSVKYKLTITMAGLAVLLIVTALAGFYGTRQANNNFLNAYERDVLPLKLLNAVDEGIYESQVDILRVRSDQSISEARELTQHVAELRASTSANWRDYQEHNVTSAEEEAIAARIAPALQEYWQRYERHLNDMVGGDFSATTDGNQLRVPFGTIVAGINEAVNLNITQVANKYANTSGAARQQMWQLGTLLVVALLLMAAAGWWLTRSIMRPLNEAGRVADEISDGNLDGHIEIIGRDEFAALLRRLREMQQQLIRVVGDVRLNAETVGSAAGQIAAGNDELSRRTQSQAASLEETAASMEQMTSTVRQNADNAAQANRVAGELRNQTSSGRDVVEQTSGAMEQISSSSKKVAEIVGLIDSIAFQTNLLALNASVEAARAGEQGRGFAVVAGEVRTLAQRSANAAKDIRQLVDDNLERVSDGSALVTRSRETLNEIAEGVTRMNDLVAEIAEASREQSSGIDQVNQAVSEMDSSTQHNAALVEESAAASRSMADSAERLREQMAFFRVADNAAATPHSAPPRLGSDQGHGYSGQQHSSQSSQWQGSGAASSQGDGARQTQKGQSSGGRSEQSSQHDSHTSARRGASQENTGSYTSGSRAKSSDTDEWETF